MVRIRQLTRKRYVKPRPFVLLLLLLIFHNNSIKPLNIKKNITARISERKKTRFSTWIPSSRSGISLQSNIPVDILQIADISSPSAKLPSENRLALSSMLHISFLYFRSVRREERAFRARKFVPSHARDLPRSSHEHPRSRARLVLLFRPLPQTESLELEQANQFYTNQGACSAFVYSRQIGVLQMKSWKETLDYWSKGLKSALKFHLPQHLQVSVRKEKKTVSLR